MRSDRAPGRPSFVLGAQDDHARLVAAILFIFVSLLHAPAWPADKDARGTLDLTRQGLADVGAFPPPPSWVPYYLPWWNWAPAYGVPHAAPYYPPYPVAPYPPPASAPVSPTPEYPPQVRPAGRLVILTAPIDAEVYVDGIRVQRQPNLTHDVALLSGPHQVNILKEGFKPFSYKVEIPPGGGLVLPVQLEKQ